MRCTGRPCDVADLERDLVIPTIASERAGVVEEVGACLLRRRAVDEQHELLVTLVPYLQRRHRLDRDDARRRQVEPLRRVAEQHRQRAGDDDEDLLLRVILVPPPARVRRLAPHARA